MVNRIDIMMFISSIHAISAELNNMNVNVPAKVFDELNAMETVLKRDYLKEMEKKP